MKQLPRKMLRRRKRTVKKRRRKKRKMRRKKRKKMKRKLKRRKKKRKQLLSLKSLKIQLKLNLLEVHQEHQSDTEFTNLLPKEEHHTLNYKALESWKPQLMEFNINQ